MHGCRYLVALGVALLLRPELGAELAPALPPDLKPTGGGPVPNVRQLAAGSEAAADAQQRAARQLGLPLEVATTRLHLLLRLVPAGSFARTARASGVPSAPPPYNQERQFSVQVSLSKGFYCGRFEVTQLQWLAVMGSNPAAHKQAGLDSPVTAVTWQDCQTFLTKLCAFEGVPAGTYRLPTEAEWEYAYRAGTTAEHYGMAPAGKDARGVGLPAISWSVNNSEGKPHPFGQKLANAWGLQDMGGNVREWCWDYFHNYPEGNVRDPAGPNQGNQRVIRGGSFAGNLGHLRAFDREIQDPVSGAGDIGLRVVRALP